MRRIGLLLLALVLAVALLGCDPGSGYGKYAELYLLLEAGDYEGAHNVIDKMAGVTATTIPPTTTVPPTTETPTVPNTTVPSTTEAPTAPTSAAPTAPTSAAPTAPTTAPDPGSGFTVLEFPYTIGRNVTATVKIQASPNTEYKIQVYYTSGPSEAAGLEPKISDGEGIVSWSWKIGGKTAPGTYRIVISGGGQSREYEFTVEAV